MSSELIYGLLAAGGAFLLLKGNNEPVGTSALPQGVPVGSGVPVQNQTPGLPVNPGLPSAPPISMPKMLSVIADQRGAAVRWSGTIRALRIKTDRFEEVVPVGAVADGFYDRAWLPTETFACFTAIDTQGVENVLDYVCDDVRGLSVAPATVPVAMPTSTTLTLQVRGNPSTGAWAVEAITNAMAPYTVDFYVNGAYERTEGGGVRCAFGGSTSCSLVTRSPGNYVVEARVKNSSGVEVIRRSITVTVPSGASVPATLPQLASLTLSVIGNLSTGWSVEAVTNAPIPYTVDFYVNGLFYHAEGGGVRCLYGGIASCDLRIRPSGTYNIEARVRQGTVELVRRSIVVTVP